MIEQPHVDQGESFFEMGCGGAVGLTGVGDAGGVVVGDDEGSAIMVEGSFNDFPRMDGGLIKAFRTE